MITTVLKNDFRNATLPHISLEQWLNSCLGSGQIKVGCWLVLMGYFGKKKSEFIHSHVVPNPV